MLLNCRLQAYREMNAPPNSSHSTYFYIKINRFVKCFDVGVGELSLDRSADRMLAVSASRFGDSGNLPHLDEPLGALLRRTECS